MGYILCWCSVALNFIDHVVDIFSSCAGRLSLIKTFSIQFIHLSEKFFALRYVITYGSTLWIEIGQRHHTFVRHLFFQLTTIKEYADG